MPFHKITYNEKYGFATLHNYGCTFRCPVCSYRLRSGADGIPGHAWPKPEKFLTVGEMQDALRKVTPYKVFFMGGEPTVAAELPEMLAFAKQELEAMTSLGHTNGSKLPLPDLDGANVGLKAWDEAVHKAYTGREKKPIFDNFAAAVAAGLEMRANMVYIPGFVDIDQLEATAAWLASLDRRIPFHIMGYIPVPGQPYVRPTEEQMAVAVAACQKHLATVKFSHLTTAHALDLAQRDDRFDVQRIA
jgi:pyruvate formate lyase activating enzyme